MFSFYFKVLFVSSVYILTVSSIPASANTFEHNPEEILKFADLNRLPWNSVVIDALVVNKSQRNEANRDYTILNKDFTKTLIAVRKPITNKGDLILMNNDGLWFYLQKTRKPIRITPIQKLTGAVSYGDVARISWSSDYEVEGIERDKELILLRLKAKTKSATYHKINLWISDKKYIPQKADVYLLSGKLFKSMEFLKYEKRAGKLMNTELKIVDRFQNNGTSYISFSKPRPSQLPNRLFLKTGMAGITLNSLEQY